MPVLQVLRCFSCCPRHGGPPRRPRMVPRKHNAMSTQCPLRNGWGLEKRLSLVKKERVERNGELAERSVHSVTTFSKIRSLLPGNSILVLVLPTGRISFQVSRNVSNVSSPARNIERDPPIPNNRKHFRGARSRPMLSNTWPSRTSVRPVTWFLVSAGGIAMIVRVPCRKSIRRRSVSPSMR